MAKVPYDKHAIMARFDEFGAVSWNGVVYTAADTLANALDRADPALFEEVQESVKPSQLLEAISDNSALDLLKEAHAENLQLVKENAQVFITNAQAETQKYRDEAETHKREVIRLQGELEKAKKNAKPAETKPAVDAGATPAATSLPSPAVPTAQANG